MEPRMHFEHGLASLPIFVATNVSLVNPATALFNKVTLNPQPLPPRTAPPR